MRDSTVDSCSASSLFETAPLDSPASTNSFRPTASSAPPLSPLHYHHGLGPSITDSGPASILPPTLTPATTTRQSVSLGVLSTLWGSSYSYHGGSYNNSNNHNTTVATSNNALLNDPHLPAIITHAPSPDTQEPLSDLTTSTSSVPSTTTTLTNTLPPTQSAALRALNAPAFQSHASPNSKSKSAKSTSSRTTLSSQPVVVRTYSGSRHNSRPSSGVNTPRLFAGMSGSASQSPSFLTAGLAGRDGRLPAADEFSFSAILRAVDPEIRDAIDAIAEICARSRMSLADEYDAHLPPQGEITASGPGWSPGMGSLVGRGRIARISQGWTATENTLTSVPEASSSSERLAGESRASTTAGTSKKRSQSAYGSLKSVISGGSGKRKAVDADLFRTPSQQQPRQGPAWAIKPSPSSKHPSITLIASPQASKQLSISPLQTSEDLPQPTDSNNPQFSEQFPAPRPATSHQRNSSRTSIPPTRTRSNTLSSLTSWLPWPRVQDQVEESNRAEARLREMLMLQSAGTGKGKAPVNGG